MPILKMAERERFELSQPVKVDTLSKRAVSATHPPLRSLRKDKLSPALIAVHNTQIEFVNNRDENLKSNLVIFTISDYRTPIEIGHST